VTAGIVACTHSYALAGFWIRACRVGQDWTGRPPRVSQSTMALRSGRGRILPNEFDGYGRERR
jgi:hypothetical protein